MTQPPLKVDGILIEPSADGSRSLTRDPSGHLLFKDPIALDGITLQKLAGLGSLSNVLIVGPSGVGAHYTTITSALDVIPSDSSKTNPYVVLILSGVYTEDIILEKDGVHLWGLGSPTISSALESTPDVGSVDHTITIRSSLGVTPKDLTFTGLVFTNAHQTKACVKIIGSSGSNLASGGFRFKSCQFEPNADSGNWSLDASMGGYLVFEGCTFKDSALSKMTFYEMTEVSFKVCQVDHALFGRYDTSEDEPSTRGGVFRLVSCNINTSSSLNPRFEITSTGSGSLVSSHTDFGLAGLFSLQGDQLHTVIHCRLPEISLGGTSQLSSFSCVDGGVNTNSNASYGRTQTTGELAFGAESSKIVTFDIPFPDTNYHVSLEVDSSTSNGDVPYITSKALTGFEVHFTTAQTLTVQWFLLRISS